MVILEVILAVCGILCIAASFLLTEDEQKLQSRQNNRKDSVVRWTERGNPPSGQ